LGIPALPGEGAVLLTTVWFMQGKSRIACPSRQVIVLSPEKASAGNCAWDRTPRRTSSGLGSWRSTVRQVRSW